MKVSTKAVNNVGSITFFRPCVSARKPQRCELNIIPTNAMADKTPLSFVVKSKSHSATGRIKLMLKVSNKTVLKIDPLSITRK